MKSLQTKFRPHGGPISVGLATILMVMGIMDGGWGTSLLAQYRGEPAPEFLLYDMAGDSYSNESLSGNPTLLMFWAPWCGVCRRELPDLANFYEESRPDSLQVLAIGGSDTQERVEEYVENHPETFVFPTAYDEDRMVMEAFRIKAFPTFVFLDEEGTILFVKRGGGLMRNAQFQQWMAQLS